MNDLSEYNGPTDFAHLHCHSKYSALDGVSTIEEYAQECVNRKWPGMAITEHGHMGSVPDFYFKFRELGLKSIFGCEIYFNDYEPVRQEIEAKGIKVRSNDWRNSNYELYQRIARNRHLTVLCKNKTGYENLIKLTTQAYQTGRFGTGRTQYNRIWFDKLCEHKEGLIILSGCLNGPVAHELRYRTLLNRDNEVLKTRTKKECLASAVEYVKKFKKVFGEDYYIELQMPGIGKTEYSPGDDEVFRDLVGIADHFKIKTALANDAHYLKREDYILQKIMMAVAQGVTIDSPDLFHVNSDEQFFKSRAELYHTFINGDYSKGVDNEAFESMCDNTLEIVDKVEKFNIDTALKLPKIQDADAELIRIVSAEIKRKGLDKIKTKFNIDGREVTYVEQAKIEIQRFVEKNFSSYFLVTRDLVRYGTMKGVPYSPRGSAGGSLVCYLLGIHSIDPMDWGLSFDRFLSPSRGGYMLNVKMGNPIKEAV